MSNINYREKYERINSQLWQRSKIDESGRLTLPQDLRKKLGIDGRKAVVLWICANRKKNRENEFVIEVGVKNNVK